MGNLTLKVKKSPFKNLVSKEAGFIARVVTNGTADFGDIAKYACKGSTISTPEMEASSKLFCEAAAEQLKNGMIVDLGPLGKLYPSVSGKWAATKEGIVKSDLTPKVNYRPGTEIAAAIAGASLSFVGETATTDETETPLEPEDPSGSDSGTDLPPLEQ